MKLGRLGGMLSDDSTLSGDGRIELIAQANGTIQVGLVVGHLATTTVNPTGAAITNVSRPIVVTTVGASASSDHLAVGIYEGRGRPSGLATTYTGLAGQHANTGDEILVTIYGLAKCKVDGNTTGIADPGDALVPSTTTAGQLMSLDVAFDAGDLPAFLYQDTTVGNTTAAAWVYCKCM
jgi:hypothetical protein